jgi:hypothetical protein
VYVQYSSGAKDVWRVFLQRLVAIDPLDGLTVQHVGSIRANTTCYRGAIWKYNNKREKICNYRAAAELMVSAHGKPDLMVQEITVNEETFEAELPEDVFDDDVNLMWFPLINMIAPQPQHHQQAQLAPVQLHFHVIFQDDDDDAMGE